MASPVPLARRLFLTGAASILCESCGDTWLKGVPQAARSYLLNGDDLHLTREDITRIPYASVAVRFSEFSQALLILGRRDGADLHWMSSEHEVIVTRHGRLVKTYGLPDDLKETRFLTDDPVGKPITTAASATACTRVIDLEPRHIDGVVVRSRFASAGREDLTILGTVLPTDVWTESNVAPDLDWSFKNQYWVDARSGYVWKSLQYLSPRLPPLEIVVYRPATKA
jgi:hypothetical protein